MTFPSDLAFSGNEQFVGVITVADAQAEAVAAILPTVICPKVKTFSSKWTTVSEDGKTTFGFLYEKCGLAIIVR